MFSNPFTDSICDRPAIDVNDGIISEFDKVTSFMFMRGEVRVVLNTGSFRRWFE